MLLARNMLVANNGSKEMLLTMGHAPLLVAVAGIQHHTTVNGPPQM